MPPAPLLAGIAASETHRNIAKRTKRQRHINKTSHRLPSAFAAIERMNAVHFTRHTATFTINTTEQRYNHRMPREAIRQRYA